MGILKFPTAAPRTSNVAAPADTIDILILRSLRAGGVWNAKDIAGMWGEDEARVRHWLTKFVKQGIVAIRPLPGNVVGFHGDVKSIDAYIDDRKRSAG